MSRLHTLLVTTLATTALALSACGETGPNSAPGEGEPARLEPVEGTDLSRVILSQRAAERLGIRTATVRESDGALVVPYAAIVYDPAGATWTYASPEPLTFVRERISVERIEGETAILSRGPPPGTTIVTVGTAELYGEELGVGH